MKNVFTLPKIITAIITAAVIAISSYGINSVADDIKENKQKLEQKVDNETLKLYIDQQKEKDAAQQKNLDKTLELMLKLIEKDSK